MLKVNKQYQSINFKDTVMLTLPSQRKLILFTCILALAIFIVDLLLPLGVAGGVPYIAVILLSLWLHNTKYVVCFSLLCIVLVLMGFYFSPEGGELWKVVSNRALAILAVSITAFLAIKWSRAQQQTLKMMHQAEKEQEKKAIYLATMQSAQHITNNLLNQLMLVKREIGKHKDFDPKVAASLDTMTEEAGRLLQSLSSVEDIEAEQITQSIKSQ